MPHISLRSMILFRLFFVTLAVCGTVGFILPTSVYAAIASHHAGHTWRGDGSSYLGSYQLADGVIAYCIDQPSGPPIGVDYSAPNYSIDVADPDNQARLAYLMRQWGASSDPSVAAAVALNVWRITGLNGKSDAYYAARANESQGSVLQHADVQLAEARIRGSRSVSANVALTVPSDGSVGNFEANLVVDRLSGSEILPAGTHVGTATLTGATFAETGSASTSITNGTSYAVVPDPHALVAVAVDVHFDSLPYGGDLGVLLPADPSRQRLLATTPANVEARTSINSGPPFVNPFPFQIAVETRTSAPISVIDSSITDFLTVSVQPTPANPLGEWGMRPSPDGPAPAVVPIISTLWGPFVDPIPESATIPPAAQHVCEVETLVTAPGEYETPPCSLVQPGYYVWTERIESFEASEGASVLPWNGRFGVDSEVTVVGWKPAIVTATSHSEAPPGTCVSDTLTVTGARPGHELPLTARLWGPFNEAPTVGTHIDPGTAPELWNATISTTGNGDFSTPCIVVNAEGFYVWTHESTGADPIRAFTSLEVFTAESTHIHTAAIPPIGHSDVPHQSGGLASTGVDGEGLNSSVLMALGIIAFGVAMVAASCAIRLRRREKNMPGIRRMRSDVR